MRSYRTARCCAQCSFLPALPLSCEASHHSFEIPLHGAGDRPMQLRSDTNCRGSQLPRHVHAVLTAKYVESAEDAAMQSRHTTLLPVRPV